MAAIIFQGARIAGVFNRMVEGAPVVRITIVATAVEEQLAIALAVPWLRRKASILTDLEKGAQVTHDVKQIHRFSADARYVGKFRAFREKADAPAVGVSFIVECAGQAFEVLEHLLRVGGGAGACSIEPLQAEMFERA